MASIFNILNRLLTLLLYKLRGERDISEPVTAQSALEEPQDWWAPQGRQDPSLDEDALNYNLEGTSGFLDVPTLLLEEDGQSVLIVDYQFGDIPSWVEWDRTWQKLSIAQMGGALAELALTPDVLRLVPFDKIRRLLLVTGPVDKRISHFVSIVIRN